jgi:hypoxanthine phosphoribosyltransferase
MNLNFRKIILTRDQIQATIRRLAAVILRWVAKTDAPGLNVICVLEGAKPFTEDLVKVFQDLKPGLKVKIHPLSSRGTAGHQLLKGRELGGERLDWETLKMDPVLIVDDLLDSGKTLAAIQEKLAAKGVTDFKTAVLIRKYADSPVPVDFCGFHLDLNREELAAQGLKDYWLFGYGMDLDGKFRELDQVAWVEIR